MTILKKYLGDKANNWMSISGYETERDFWQTNSPIDEGTIYDHAHAYLRSLGHVGTLHDMLNAWAQTLTTEVGTLDDKLRTASQTALSALDLTTKQFAHYKCNDNAASTVVVDSMGTHNAATRSTNTSSMSASGKVNNSLYVNEDTNRLIDTPAHSDFDLSGTYAIALWFNSDVTHNSASATDRLIQHAGSKYLLRLDPDGFLEWNADDGTNHVINSNSSSWTLNTWYHCVVQWDGSEMAMWVDGVKQTETSADGAVVGGGGTNVIFGASGVDSQLFDGSFDDIRFFNDSLTTDEIAFIYNSGGGTEDNS